MSEEIQKRVDYYVKGVQRQFKETKQNDLIVAYALSFLLCFFHSHFFRDKATSALNFGVLFYAALLGTVAISVRIKPSLEDQYMVTLLLVNIAGLVVTTTSFAALFLAMVPVIINYAARYIKV